MSLPSLQFHAKKCVRFVGEVVSDGGLLILVKLRGCPTGVKFRQTPQ
jgi:hypothetical protein